MKRIGVICFIGLFIILGGMVITDFLGNQEDGYVLIGPPEGYEEPTALDRIQRQSRSMVKQLEIENSVLKDYGDMLEYVAFAPGSGWLKINTRDGLSPTLSFNKVSHKDIQKFNQFSKSIGLPIRTEFSGNVLRITRGDTDKRSLFVANTKGTVTDARSDIGSMKRIEFFQPEETPRLVIHRDRGGKVHLVAKGKAKPESVPEKKKIDVFIAQKDKKDK